MATQYVPQVVAVCGQYKWFTATLNQINTIINEINSDAHIPYMSPKFIYGNKLRKIVLKWQK